MKKRNQLQLLFVLILTSLFINSCGGAGGSSDNDNTISTATQQSVGRELFFDETLSSNGNQSCASCHDPESGFADPDVTISNPVSEGSVSGQFGNRNAPTSAYASFIPEFDLVTTQTPATDSKFIGGQFLDGRRSSLAEQAKDPFLNTVEMNNADKADVVSKVKIATYAEDFKAVFGEAVFDDTETAYDNIATAIAAFESSEEMNPFSSKFDAVMAGQVSFTASEQNGFDLFKGTKAKCSNCHSVNSPANGSLFTDFQYFNIGTPSNPANPAVVADNTFIDEGLGASPVITDPVDQITEGGKFRTPTLRNIAATAPYMHNGVYESLDDVIRHYDISVANFDGFGSFSPEVTDNIANELNEGTFNVLGLTLQEQTDLVNFLNTLTDGFM